MSVELHGLSQFAQSAIVAPSAFSPSPNSGGKLVPQRAK